MYKYPLILFLLIAGCAKDSLVVKSDATLKVDNAIVQELSSADQDDLKVMFKQMAGVAEYLEHAGREIDSTAQLWTVIEKFQSDYGYEVKKYESVGKFLSKYEDIKTIGNTNDIETVDRKQVIEDFRIIANSIRSNLK